MSPKATFQTEIAVGDVLKERNGERIYIVLKTGARQRWTHLIDTEYQKESAANHRAQPFKLKTDEVLLRLSPNVETEYALEKLSGLPVIVSERRRESPLANTRRSEKYRAIADDPALSKGWKLIEALLTFDQPTREDGASAPYSIHGDAFEELLHRETRAKRISRCSEIMHVSQDTLYRTLRRFFQRGLTPAAAADDYDRCGGRGKQRNWKRRPGHTATKRLFSASARGDEVRRLLHLAADYYLSFEYAKGKRSQKTMDAALDWLRATFFCDRVVYNDKREMVELNLSRRIVITRRQLQYYICQNYPYEVRRIHQVGRKKYALHERPLTGKLRTSRGPGEKYHIDATIVDLYLVGNILRNTVIGRPTLYLVVDDYTALVVGFYVTFDPPSWDGAMIALANAISPKVEFCRSLGIDISEGQWPAHRLCEVLYADQGEVSSVHKAHPLIRHFGVELANAPAYRPDLRSVIERRFGIIPAIWSSLLSGVVEKGSLDRGVEHPAYQAALNIREFRRAVLRAVLSYNRCPIRGYQTPPEMVEVGEAPSPLNLWKYGLKTNGCGRHVDVADFRAKIMKSENVSVDGNGIHHQGLHYACPDLSIVERQAMHRAKGGSDLTVEIRYDSADTSSIELLGFGAPISCPLNEGERDRFSGLTYKELAIDKDLRSTASAMEHEAGEADRAMTAYNIAKIGRDAVAATKAALKASGRRRPDITHMEEMRQVERSIDRRGSTTASKLAQSKGDRKVLTNASKGEAMRMSVARTTREVTYDIDGDASKAQPGDSDSYTSGNSRSRVKELREKRARALLEALESRGEK
ncbi:integrase catalytic subunit [Burkholderia lata]|uniref:Integrase catalytic subunit n=1 Tax=Burkholderia lata (strain ATCC 17760 / DSM 23089 / LMG 22485 / NCIMB 9086 / R18194 / 383) TaxID=482957 RepID=A0A6P2UX13_BURL3|nr:Mu transposase C-terminal domain-containing protein [Burkholderia lata]VWC75752.1 integrase catalytic subunit [Burkholderia lata]